MTGCVVIYRRQRKERKTPPPVTELISSHKQAASGTLGLRDKKRPVELPNPSPDRHQCHKVSHDWLNKNTKSVEVPASHLGLWTPPLKGRGSYFSFLGPLSGLCGSFWSAVKPVIHSQSASGILAVRGKFNARFIFLVECAGNMVHSFQGSSLLGLV